MTSWDEITAQHEPTQKSVRVPMRASLLDEISKLEAEAERQQQLDKMSNEPDAAPAVAQRIQELEAELAASEVEFVFRAVGKRPLQQLIAEHPPTDDQIREAEQNGMRAVRNEDTFQPALLHASCISPADSTLEGWQTICERWSDGQFAALWQACLLANFGGGESGPKSLIASGILHGSATNSTTAPR